MYLQPSGITSELLAVMARHANICDYLDIPLQHANARVLRDMNRSGSGEEYLALLARIRAALPDVTLRTTVIAGFPGETRAEARELERFIERAAFDYVGVFPYSREEGTVAGARTDQVPPRTRRARAQRLRDLADAIGFAKVAARIGDTEEVLVTDYDEDVDYLLLGRTRRQAPEVDGMVHLDKGSIGELVSATMVESYCYELDGRVAGARDV
jgi:ribosomal protein S12 methylthiotransferase